MGKEIAQPINGLAHCMWVIPRQINATIIHLPHQIWMKLGLSKILQYITSDKLVRMLSPPEHKLELNFCELT